MSLRFKGDKPKKHGKRKEREEQVGEEEQDDDMTAEWSADPISGTGAVMSSGVVVMGLDTNFSKELQVGDTLLVTVNDRFRNTVSDEARTINMVLGKDSLNVNAPFSCDLTAASPFMFVKKKPDLEALRAAKREKKRLAKEGAEESKSVTYKVVVPGSGTFKRWDIVTEHGVSMSREQMLDKRAKNKADRHCR